MASHGLDSFNIPSSVLKALDFSECFDEDELFPKDDLQLSLKDSDQKMKNGLLQRSAFNLLDKTRKSN